MNICDVARQVKSKANKNYDKRVGARWTKGGRCETDEMGVGASLTKCVWGKAVKMWVGCMWRRQGWG